MNISIDVSKAVAKLAVNTRIIDKALAGGIAAAHDLMQRYPPPRPRQRYIRTGQLRGKLAIIRVSPTRHAIVNTTSYARWVHGPPQAWYHRNRWVHVDEAREAAVREAIDILREELGL